MLKRALPIWHRRIGWGAAIALFIWGASAVMHPLMVWFGPKAERSFPPSMQIDAAELTEFDALLASVPDLPSARIIKMVPGETGPLLQITRDQRVPREYFDPQSSTANPDHDQTQAEWLATHYTGLSRDAIRQVDFLTEFTSEYPAVNRLTPVYRIAFGDDDSTVAFIHTETGALASLSNTFKRSVQNVFQQLHTFRWLDRIEYGRILLMSFFVLSLLGTAVVGILLVLVIKTRPIPNSARRYHRRLAYALWLPLLAWSTSGFYHLLQSSLVASEFGLRLGEPYAALGDSAPTTERLTTLVGQRLNSLALVRHENQQFYWRASVSSEQTSEASSREARFSGNPNEASALYLSADSSDGAGSGPDPVDDASFAQHLALSFAGGLPENVHSVSQVRRFGAGYDFRNKRLPVWKVEFNDEQGSRLFVDTATGVLVDRSSGLDRTEAWVFNIFHKWSHLTPYVGPKNRDLLIVLTIGLLLSLNSLGVAMLLKKRRSKRRTPAPDPIGAAPPVADARVS